MQFWEHMQMEDQAEEQMDLLGLGKEIIIDSEWEEFCVLSASIY